MIAISLVPRPIAINSVLILFLLLWLANSGYSQSYFQQQTDYSIQVTLDDSLHTLSGTETIEYTNNSDESLSQLYFHLWPNAYKNNTTAFARQMVENGDCKFWYSKEIDRGYIDSLNFKVNGISVKWELLKDTIDICILHLNTPILPGETAKITTPFFVKIPSGKFSRLGHIGRSYQISQWYPKPAVFDKNGWHAMPYLNQGEFYSEYGSFDVTITLPSDYVVGSTGDLDEGCAEINWLVKKDEATRRWLLSGKKEIVQYPVSSPLKTVHYHQENIHDFAWFADRNYNVLKSSVKLPDSGREVTTYAMFNDKRSAFWKRAPEYINDALFYYSQWIGEYPYRQATAVEGALGAGGGMEYPNVTIIGDMPVGTLLEEVIMHEVGHNWFYGILGSNERNYPWMDEGVNTFFESRYLQNKYKNKSLGEILIGKGHISNLDKFPVRQVYYLGYLFSESYHLDQPLNLASQEYQMINYGTICYYKGGIAFHYLKSYIGEPLFDSIMHEYFDTWKFKHPQPEDLKAVFTKRCSKDLSWFWDDVMGTTKRLDYKLKSAKKIDNPNEKSGLTYELEIKNKGSISGPFSLSGIKEGKVTETFWVDGFRDTKTISHRFKDFDRVQIDALLDMPEVKRSNNFIDTKSVFKRKFTYRLSCLYRLDEPDIREMFWLPVVAWNAYDKLMIGTAFYNHQLIPKALDYAFVPLYSFETGKIKGISDVGYSFYLNVRDIRRVRLGVSTKSFSYSDIPFMESYQRIVPEVKVDLRNRKARNQLKNSVRFRYLYIDKEVASFNFEEHKYERAHSYYNIQELSFYGDNKRLINPYGYKVVAERSKESIKASIEGNYRLSYAGERKGLDIRFFASRFFSTNASVSQDYRIRMSGIRGYQDYKFDYLFFGRSAVYNNILSQQFAMADGGFKEFTGIGQSWDWLVATNLKISLPGKIPFRLFIDAGTYKDAGAMFSSSKKIVYDGGAMLNVIPDIFEVYFPAFMSDDLKMYKELNTDNYWQNVRFTLHLEKLNPFKQIFNTAY